MATMVIHFGETMTYGASTKTFDRCKAPVFTSSGVTYEEDDMLVFRPWHVIRHVKYTKDWPQTIRYRPE